MGLTFELDCLRSAGPIVGPAWLCSDGPDGTTCSTDDPTLIDSSPSTVLDADDDLGLPADETCAEHVRTLIEQLGLMGGLGSIQERDGGTTTGTPLGDIYEWDCTNDGEERICTDPHRSDAIAPDDRDNPGRSDGPGWRCEDGPDGRRCVFAGNGALARDEADLRLDDLTLSTAVTSRDQWIIDQGAEDSDLFRLQSSIATSCSGQGTCLGFLGGDGVLGRAPLVGAGGLIDNDGRVTAVNSEDGLESR